MKRISNFVLAAIVAASTGSIATPVHAQASTSNLSAWDRFGDVSTQAGALFLTTAGLDESPVSGIAAVDYAALTNAAGVDSTAFDLGLAFANEGSLAQQSFNVLAGQQLSFNWSFSTEDVDTVDHAFAVINGQVISLFTGSPSAPVLHQGFSHTFTSSGLATLALGVVDTGDNFYGVSTLAVQNLSVTNVATVSEPETLVMLLTGLGVAGWVRRRQQGKTSAA